MGAHSVFSPNSFAMVKWWFKKKKQLVLHKLGKGSQEQLPTPVPIQQGLQLRADISYLAPTWQSRTMMVFAWLEKGGSAQEVSFAHPSAKT